jgi:hypothetical protein
VCSVETCSSQVSSPSSAARSRGVDQRRREVDAGHLGAPRGRALRHRAGAAREIQPTHPRRRPVRSLAAQPTGPAARCQAPVVSMIRNLPAASRPRSMQSTRATSTSTSAAPRSAGFERSPPAIASRAGSAEAPGAARPARAGAGGRGGSGTAPAPRRRPSGCAARADGPRSGRPAPLASSGGRRERRASSS